MLLQAWSIALIVTSVVTLFLILFASLVAVRILRYWRAGSDSALQIRLEGETWLASALMQYCLVFQMFSLLMLVLAADHFAGQLVGAMCATGALTANGFGIPVLVNKILLVFFGGYWLLIHHLDMQVETTPLVRFKFWWVLVLMVLVCVDGALLTGYLANLSPDVITSCCGVLIRPGEGDGYNLLDPFSLPLLLGLFYGLAVTLVAISWLLLREGELVGRWLRYLHAALWALFFPVALWAITIYFSSYIYAMPSHRCPFDILQPQFHGIGYPIYATLFAATFWGTAGGVAQLVAGMEPLAGHVYSFQRFGVRFSLCVLPIFLLLTGYAPLRYFLGGGEG